MNDELLTRFLTATDGPTGRLLLLHGVRGSGKSWWVDRGAERARSAGYAVLRAGGRDSSAETVRAIIAATHTAPVCVVVDDIDFLDAAVRHDVRGAIEASGGIALVSAASSSAFDGALEVRLEPLGADVLAELLVRRGVAPQAAHRCAIAAAGNPGLAVSLADGLSDAQRADLSAVPEMPRLAAEVASDLHERLRRLGERTCRALAVAAADEDGNLLAIRSALKRLGEGAGAGELVDDGVSLEALFDAAEEAAIVDVVGARVSFVDPWLRLAAYHLVAPASRRAAHRALAAAYDSPRQGGARVRHLVAASSGPSDEVAQALMVVASAVARRGDRSAAVRMATQAAELSVNSELRSASLLRAIGWCLDGGDYLQAQRLVDELDGLDGDERRAAQEVAALLHGDDEVSADAEIASPMSEREVAGWQGRRRQRLGWWADAEAGRHGRSIQQIRGDAAPAELWARGMALRHGGLVRDAAELVARTLAMLPPGASRVRERWELLDADLALLTGRCADAVPTLYSADNDGAARALVVRAALAAAPTLQRNSACIHVPARDPLCGIRREQLRGVSTADHHTLAAAAAVAEAQGLPIEAGESWLIAAELALAGGPSAAPDQGGEYARKASDVLHRCAVRCWDARLQGLLALAHALPSPSPTVVLDPEMDALSAAEWRVAASVAEGLTNREVAAALFLSVKTVDFHLQQIYRKLTLRSRTELAVRFAGRTHNPARRSSPPEGARR